MKLDNSASLSTSLLIYPIPIKINQPNLIAHPYRYQVELRRHLFAGQQPQEQPHTTYLALVVVHNLFGSLSTPPLQHGYHEP